MTDKVTPPENPPAFHSGITLRELRDWFAGQIACGMAGHSGTAGASFGPGDIAARSYEVADALLAERAKSLSLSGGEEK